MSEKNKKMNFYSLERILKENATYNVIIGERSNGKTFSVLKRMLEKYLKKGEQGAIIRRWADDFKRQRGQQMWDGIIAAGGLAGTEWEGIDFKSGMWYLYRYDEDLRKKVYDREPLAFSFALGTMEHDKSTSYTGVTTILFDEFLSRQSYLPDEFVLFMNTISTIIRYRDNVEIFMCANTVNKSAPYFSEMGLKHINKMEQGKIDVYTYGTSELKVAVEYCATIQKEGKPSDKYFAFDNPKLQMITGGAWEVSVYPHLPIKYKPKDVKYSYFVQWEDEILQCEIIKVNKISFTYIHRKTSPIKDEDKDLIFSPKPDPRKNWRRRISVPTDNTTKKIWQFFIEDKVYYQDNEIGEIMRNYLNFSKSFAIISS